MQCWIIACRPAWPVEDKGEHAWVGFVNQLAVCPEK